MAPALLLLFIFVVGLLTGALGLLLVAYIVLFNVFGKQRPPPPFIDQFQPLKIPHVRTSRWVFVLFTPLI